MQTLRNPTHLSKASCGSRRCARKLVLRASVAPSPAQGAQRATSPTIEEQRRVVRETMQWFRVPPKVYFKGGCMEVALAELAGKQRAFIITDKNLYDDGFAEKVVDILDKKHHIQTQIFYHVKADPSMDAVQAAIREVNDFRPDVILAMGGGSPMDVAKATWALYERPGLTFEQLVAESQSSRSRVHESMSLGTKALCICIPTTSGTGSEVTPFASIRDTATGHKFTLADYSLTPSMAIVDPQLVVTLPAKQTAHGGMTTLAQAIESFISVFSSPYTQGLSKHALTMLTRYYERAYKKGNMDYHAREKMHNAATVAGLAFSNTYLGICHSLASELSSRYGVSTGLAKSLLITPVLRLQARDPVTLSGLGELSDHLHLGGTSPKDKFDRLLGWIRALQMAVELPLSLEAVLGPNKAAVFEADLPALVEGALEDAHAMASPVQGSEEDLKAVLRDAWKCK